MHRNRPTRVRPGALLGLALVAYTAGAAAHPASPRHLAPVLAQRTSTRGAAYQCFRWVHGRAFSTDCYRTLAGCNRARTRMRRGHRETTACELTREVACTVVSRPPQDPRRTEHCFGDDHACERFRAYVQGSGLTAEACRDR